MIKFMAEPSDQELAAALLYKFYYKRAGVKYHIYGSDVPKGFPPHLRKRLMAAAQELYRRGLLRKFPHGGEHVWQLNLDRLAEIKDLINRFYPGVV